MLQTPGNSQWSQLLGPVALVGGTMITALAVYADAWWHVTFGRDTFWIPPHIAVYTGVLASLGGFLWVWSVEEKIPGGLGIYIIGIVSVIAAGYGDQLWHQRFGVERIGTLAAIWSPTHIAALIAGAITASGIILYIFQKIKAGGPPILGWLLAGEFAALVSILTLVMLPLGPETPFRVIGIIGAPLVAFVVLYLRFTGRFLSMKTGALTLITAFDWTGNAVILSTDASRNLVSLVLVAGILPAVLGDLIIYRLDWLHKKGIGYALAGLAWGVIFGSVFYPLTNGLLSPPLDPTSLVLIAIGSSIAGLASGVLAWKQWSQFTIPSIISYVQVKQEVVPRA
jgi:hypothetical protein